MNKKIVSLCLVLALPVIMHGQVYFTKNGTISFYSSTPIEEIHAVNDKAVSVLNLDESTVEWSVLIKGFLFKNALMQTHFNENYMDSDQYPKAVFKSTMMDLSQCTFSEDGTYTAPLKGVLTVRGKEKEVETNAVFEVSGGNISGSAKFEVSPADFNIEIPALVREKIAKEIEVTVEAAYELYEKS
jgi:hypothetical protein